MLWIDWGAAVVGKRHSDGWAGSLHCVGLSGFDGIAILGLAAHGFADWQGLERGLSPQVFSQCFQTVDLADQFCHAA